MASSRSTTMMYSPETIKPSWTNKYKTMLGAKVEDFDDEDLLKELLSGDDTKHIARDVNNKGAKVYGKIPGTRADVHHWFMNNDFSAYELIRDDKPCCLHFDLDFEEGDDELTVNNLTGQEVLHYVLDTMKEFVGEENQDLLADTVVMECVREHKPKKRSFHITYPHCVFGNNYEIMDKFSLILRRFMYEVCFPKKENMKENFTFNKINARGKRNEYIPLDMLIYSKRRLMRGVHQSKFAEPTSIMRIITCTNEADWMIQPPEMITQAQDYADIIIRTTNLTEQLFEKYAPDGILKMVDGDFVCFRNYTTKKTPGSRSKKNAANFDTFTTQLSPYINDEVIELNEFKHLLDLVHYEHLKMDYGRLLLPFLTSIAPVTTDEELLEWMDTPKDDKERIAKNMDKIKDVRKRAEDLWIAGDMAMKCLRMVCEPSVKIINNLPLHRVKKMENTEVIVPTVEEGWKFVRAEDMEQYITSEISYDVRLASKVDSGEDGKDSKYLDTLKGQQSMPKRGIIVSGVMGSGKGTGLKSVIEKMCRSGVFKDVLIIVPRRLLATQTAGDLEELHSIRVNEIIPSQSNYDKTVFHKNKCMPVKVIRKYAGAKQDKEDSDKEHPRINLFECNQQGEAISRVYVSVFNSLPYLRKRVFDAVVIDEPAVTIGNLYLKRDSPVEEKKAYESLTTVLSEIMRNAKKSFYLDAAFTPDILDICNYVYDGHYSKDDNPTNEEILKFMGKPCNYLGNKWLRRQLEDGAEFKRGKPTKLQEQRGVKPWIEKVYPMKYVCSYDPRLEKPIFDHLHEFEDPYAMIKHMLDAVYKRNLRCLVYLSTTTQGEAICQKVFGMRENDTDKLPKVFVYSHDSVEQLGAKECESRLLDRKYDLVECSSALGIGANYPQKHLFDNVYLFMEFGRNTPQLADMVQLAARMRNSSNKTLHYTIKVSGERIPPHANRLLKMEGASGFDYLKHLCDKAYTATRAINKAGASDIRLMREMAKEALSTGFRFITRDGLETVYPTYELNKTKVPVAEVNAINRRGARQRKAVEHAHGVNSYEFTEIVSVNRKRPRTEETTKEERERYSKRAMMDDPRKKNQVMDDILAAIQQDKRWTEIEVYPVQQRVFYEIVSKREIGIEVDMEKAVKQFITRAYKDNQIMNYKRIAKSGVDVSKFEKYKLHFNNHFNDTKTGVVTAPIRPRAGRGSAKSAGEEQEEQIDMDVDLEEETDEDETLTDHINNRFSENPQVEPNADDLRELMVTTP